MTHSADDIAFLQARTRPPEPPLYCWHWTGALTAEGYPIVELRGRRVLAVRAAYIAEFGSIPPGQRPLQSCPDPLCICPFHLKLVAASFRRLAVGYSGPRVKKLTHDQVREIRASELSPTELGQKFSVSASHISDIRRGRRKRAVV